jgi:Holliday junction resolvase-like predicted endonuclease
MRPYRNLSGHSGVVAYEIGVDFIEVKFRSGPPYRYTYEGVGREKVEWMKALAVAGMGLATFINQHPEVKSGYER